MAANHRIWGGPFFSSMALFFGSLDEDGFSKGAKKAKVSYRYFAHIRASVGVLGRYFGGSAF